MNLRTNHELCVQFVKFTNCTLSFHLMSVVPP